MRLEGRLDSAQALHEGTLQLRIESLGVEHPDTLTSMNNLANTFADQGGMVSAIELHRAVLEIRVRIVGRLHPYTLNSMSNLALALEEHGETFEAIKLMAQALEGRTSSRSTPRHHPVTDKPHGYARRAVYSEHDV